MDSFRFINVERRDDVCCIRLKKTRLEENEIQLLGQELIELCEKDGCRKLALSLGPEPPDCLYSVFLAKLIAVRNAIQRQRGQMVLCDLSPVAYSVFEACLLHREFTFADNLASAIAKLSTKTE
jgi:hypothetical protein